MQPKRLSFTFALLTLMLQLVWMPYASAASKMINLSTNGYVSEFGLRAGFIIEGDEPRRIIVLGERFQSDIDPILTLTDLEGNAIYSNDNWQSDPTADEVTRTLGRTPGTPTDAAFAITLNPGVYIARLDSNNGTFGNGIVAVNDLGEPAPQPSELQASDFFNSVWRGTRRFTVMNGPYAGAYCTWMEIAHLDNDFTGRATADLISRSSIDLGCAQSANFGFRWEYVDQAVLITITSAPDVILFGDGNLTFHVVDRNTMSENDTLVIDGYTFNEQATYTRQ